MNDLLKQYGLTRTKLAVIAGLVALLAGVWGNALLGGKTSTSRRPPREPAAQKGDQTAGRSSRSRPNNASNNANAKRQPRVPRTITLPPVDLAELVTQDPFAPPAWARQGTAEVRRQTTPTLSEEEETLEQLRSTGVSVVVLSGGEKIATIGDRRVRPGDTLSGRRVLDITPAGVVLSDEPVNDDTP